jgi:hypothetical protein
MHVFQILTLCILLFFMPNDEDKDNDRSKHSLPIVSRQLSDGTVVELLYRPLEQHTLFAVYNAGR